MSLPSSSKNGRASRLEKSWCAGVGRLLMLAPAAWPYQVNEKPMTRFDATALNRLCRWLAGPGAAEINYHGMKPRNVDELALASVAGPEALRGVTDFDNMFGKLAGRQGVFWSVCRKNNTNNL